MAGKPKQFGLIMPKKNQLSAPKAANVFGDDSDLDEDDGVDWVEKSLKAEGEKLRMKKQTRINAERALAEDPTIYQYDEVYAEIHVDTKKKKEKKKEEPKYITKLLENAEKRKRENEVRVERMVQKEREAEGDMFKDKEKFVTASYRKKLEEFKLLEEQDKEKERLETIGEVTKQGNIDGFYRHIYSQTFDIGGRKETPVKKEVEIKTEPEDEDKKADSSKKNLDADDSSVNDSSSDEQENKKEAMKIVSKNRKEKQYRKRVAEASESESEEEIVKEKEKPEKSFEEKNSEEIRLETEKDKNHEERSTTPEVKKKKKEKEEKETEKTEDVENIPKKRKKEDEEKPKPRKPEKKTKIWEKRTVGPVFEAALQRYYIRQAARVQGS